MHTAFTLSESLEVGKCITVNSENNLLKRKPLYKRDQKKKTCTNIILDIFVCGYVCVSVYSHVCVPTCVYICMEVRGRHLVSSTITHHLIY